MKTKNQYLISNYCGGLKKSNMKEVKNGKEVETLPRNFDCVKREFQKALNMYLARNKVISVKHEETWMEDEYKNTKDQYALLYILLSDLRGYLDTKEEEIVNKMLEEMGDDKVIYLKEYGMKVWYDDEAKWFNIEEINEEDWKMLDKKANEEYIKNWGKK